MRRLAMAFGVGGLLWGCGSDPLQRAGEAQRASIVSAAPVTVFLPGTLASVLENRDSGETVWGLDDALSLDPRTQRGLRQLALPISEVPATMSAALDDVRAPRILRRAATRVLGLRLSLSVYDDAFAGLVIAGLPEAAPGAIPAAGPALVPFPYDWRRSIVDGAQALSAALEARPEGAEKVTLVGHSMGGAVALWYLMHGGAAFEPDDPPPVTWAGAEHVAKAILIAPPLRGSAVAVRNTINGNRLAGPLVPVYPPVMLATHPSSFELMPRGADAVEGLDSPRLPLDPAVWEAHGWGLAETGIDLELGWLAGAGEAPRERALARQKTLIARGAAFQRAADRAIEPPEGLELVLIAGEGRETPAAVAVQADGSVAISRRTTGDGVVPFASASAGFANAPAHPRKTLHTVEAEHARMVSDPAVFKLLLRELASGG